MRQEGDLERGLKAVRREEGHRSSWQQETVGLGGRRKGVEEGKGKRRGQGS